jgi:hypothetical protein
VVTTIRYLVDALVNVDPWSDLTEMECFAAHRVTGGSDDREQPNQAKSVDSG